jgi:hypothetical protein
MDFNILPNTSRHLIIQTPTNFTDLFNLIPFEFEVNVPLSLASRPETIQQPLYDD